MSKYNPTQRARDLKRENSVLRSQMRQLIAVMDKQEHESYLAGESWGRRVSRTDAATLAQQYLASSKRKVRNHRILSSVLLVLAVAGWLV